MFDYICEGQLSFFDVLEEYEPQAKNKGSVTILNSDCLEYMKKQKNARFDVTFTSPPYNDSGNENDGCEEKKFRHRKYTYVEKRDDWFEWQCECIREMQRITKKFVLYNVQALLSNKNDVYKIIGEFADDIHMILIWYKPNAQPQHYPHRIANCYEMVIVFKGKEFNKKKFWINNNGQKNVIIQNINPNKKYSKHHRALMSYGFAEEIIENYTELNDEVFDPFCGLGTTGIACYKKGRNFTGTELNENYFKMALDRIADECK